MRREVSAEDRVSGPEVGLSLRERKSVRYSGALPWRHLKTYIQILNFSLLITLKHGFTFMYVIMFIDYDHATWFIRFLEN